jgi:hypothetical protein
MLVGLGAHPLTGQSLTGGALRGEIILADGTPVGTVSITLEDESGLGIRQFQADFKGRFSVPLLPPGRYSLLVEKAGYQPLRQRGVEIIADLVTILRVRVVRRPPPITRVEDIEVAEQRFSSSAPRIAEVTGRPASTWQAPRNELSSDGRNSAFAASPRDTRWGFANTLGGLPQDRSKLLVDGLPGSWYRHPGVEPEPGGAPVYPRFLFQQSQVVPHATDVEWPGGNGGMLGAVSRAPTQQFRFEPFAFYSGALGQPASQNPGDSSLTSINAGATISGALVPNKAGYVIGFGYEELELPTAAPWEVDTARFNGVTVPLVSTLEAIARDSLGTSIGSHVRPVVRSYRGGSGGFRLDWRLSRTVNVVTRANLARFREWNPEVGQDPSNSSSARLDSRDFSGATTVEFASGAYGNEFRLGIRRTKREWDGSGIPSTTLANEGVGLGGLPILPADFELTTVDVADALQYSFGNQGEHRIKAGFQYSSGHWTQDYLFGADGGFAFGDLESFANRRGAFFVTEATDARTRFTLREVALFGHITWRVMPSVSMLAGLRWDRQLFPLRRENPIQLDQAFLTVFGIPNSGPPDDNNNVAPRLGFVWDPGGNSPWAGSFSASRHFGQLNPTRYAEAALHDGAVTVRRAVGDLGSWTTLPDATVAPSAGRRFTLFSPRDEYKNPRTTKVDVELTRVLQGLGTVRLTGGYHHTDFLLRRTDLNLLGAPTGVTQEGRPVFGTLLQEGGVLAAAPGSNRRINGYDMVSALSSTGFQDHYEVGVLFSREAARGLSISGGYVWSRTRDNWLQSWSGDPADELSPFPADQLGREWAEGRSDFDLPHRATALLSWTTGSRSPVTIGARYRFRSGLPFTPGFRPGVDANADGSGRNDPAFLDPAVPGMPGLLTTNPCLKEQSGEFAGRNSCREPASHALDLSASVGLPLRSLGGRLEFMVDVFNLAATATGVVDRAVLLVDPAGTVITDALGNVTLPLIANPRFGKLLSRRTEPRMVRFGLRLAY